MSNENENENARPPFAGHRAYYVALKVLVLVVAVVIAYRYLANG